MKDWPLILCEARNEMDLLVSVLAHGLKVIGSGRNPAGRGCSGPLLP